MTLTVLMPVYNGEKYLSEAVESILNQTYSDFEFLIIDDGSTDRTGELLKHYAESDKRIRLVQHAKNLGLVRTLNEGLTLASGDWIARMDADDVSLPKRFEKQVKYLHSHQNIVLLGTQITVVDEIQNRQWLKVNPTESNSIRFYSCLNSPFFHPTVFIRRDIVLKVGGYKNISFAEDYDLWSEIIHRHEIANLNEPLLHYRRYEGSTTTSKAARDLQTTQAMAIAKQNISRLFPKATDINRGHLHSFMKVHTLRWNETNQDWHAVRDILQQHLRDVRERKKISYRLYLLNYLFHLWLLKLTVVPWSDKRKLLRHFFLDELKENFGFGVQLLFE